MSKTIIKFSELCKVEDLYTKKAFMEAMNIWLIINTLCSVFLKKSRTQIMCWEWCHTPSLQSKDQGN